jgi:DNA polymerase-3 subunit delta'
MNTLSLLITTSAPQTDVLSHITLPEPAKHPDVIWFNPDGAPLTIDVIRDLQQQVLTKPYQAETRYFILQSVELATVEAQQALLKLLEEPPKHIQFILTSAYPGMILPTILSRVSVITKRYNEEFDDKAVSIDQLSQMSLAEKFDWAASQENPTQTVLELIETHITTFEKNPTLNQIRQLKTLQQTLAFLNAKTNSKLAMEWMVIHL